MVAGLNPAGVSGGVTVGADTVGGAGGFGTSTDTLTGSTFVTLILPNGVIAPGAFTAIVGAVGVCGKPTFGASGLDAFTLIDGADCTDTVGVVTGFCVTVFSEIFFSATVFGEIL
ncbi:hypothetical protein, partial [Fusobacterium necrophorum]